MLPLPSPPTLRGKSCWAFAAGAVVLLILTAFFLLRAVGGEHDNLKFCLGEEASLREGFTQIIQAEAAKCGLNLSICYGTRGEETVQRVARGECDAAIVFGGLGVENPEVRQVACLRGEPLHLFVKPEIAPLGLAGLLGKRVNVGPRNGETQAALRKVLRHMDVKPGVDFVEEHHDLADLLAMKAEEMPDGIFLSAGLPSPTGKKLVHQHGYRLVEVPFGEVLALQHPSIFDSTIPANTYGYHPAVPETSLRTVGCHTMVIANRNASPRAVSRLLELLCESDLPRRIGRKPLDAATLVRVRDFPLHEGAVKYFGRNDPWISQKLIDRFSQLKELSISGASAILLMWGWMRRRPAWDYKTFLDRAAAIELDVCRLVDEGTFDDADRAEASEALLKLKIDALEKHRQGLLPGDRPLFEFLDRVRQAADAIERLSPRRLRRPA